LKSLIHLQAVCLVVVAIMRLDCSRLYYRSYTLNARLATLIHVAVSGQIRSYRLPIIIVTLCRTSIRSHFKLIPASPHTAVRWCVRIYFNLFSFFVPTPQMQQQATAPRKSITSKPHSEGTIGAITIGK